MKYLIVFAHPNPDSFNHAILDTVINKLTGLGVTVTVRDLYKINFNPCLGIKDLEAAHTGVVPEDVKTEQEFINEAENIIFISPIWWEGLPAILKGYFDRVFSLNFAYAGSDSGITGLLTNKKFGMYNTFGGTEEEQHRTHLADAFKLQIEKGIFDTCNSPLCFHHLFYNVELAGDKSRKEMLESINNDMEKFVLDPKFCPFFS